MLRMFSVCDRCGNENYKNNKFMNRLLIGEDPVRGIRIRNDGSFHEPRIDLCDDCLTKLGLFLHGVELIETNMCRELVDDVVREELRLNGED